jgi:Tfp pilus assembly protein PilX
MSVRAGFTEERGFALVTSIIVLAIVLTLGLVALQITDVQTHQTGNEVRGEAAFNMAESALDAEASQLQLSWPTAAPGYPACNQASTAGTGCPGTSLTSSFNSAYSGPQFANPVWSTQVIDDANGPSYYADSLAGTAPSYDSNGDDKLWIRAEATVGGQRRIVVAQMLRQVVVVNLPQNVITSGGLHTSNNGNKIIIEAKDPNSGLTGGVALRCGTASTQPTYGDTCAGWDPKQGQLDPAGAYQTAYTDPGGAYQALSNATIQSLRNTAVLNGTDYPPGQCPQYGATGVLFVESADCTYSGTGGQPWGTDATPVMLIIANGTLTFGANVDFTGIIYMVNGQGTTPAPGQQCSAAQWNQVFTVQGGGALHGALFVDKCGTVDAGDKAFDIDYDTNAFKSARAYATPALAKNTFRIVPNK